MKVLTKINNFINEWILSIYQLQEDYDNWLRKKQEQKEKKLNTPKY